MKKILFTLLLSSVFANGQIVNIPDANFKQLLTQSACVDLDNDGLGDADADTNNDGEIQMTEAAIVNALFVTGLSVSNSGGLEAFTNLQRLTIHSQSLTSIDVSALSQLTYFSCSDSQLSTLELSGLNNLQYFDCSHNNLIDLPLNGLTQLHILKCNNNGLAALDVSGLSVLDTLSCSQNQIQTLDAAGLTNLKYLDCDHNLLTTLNLSGLTNLTHMNFANNQLSTINSFDLINLTSYNCNDNPLNAIDVSHLVNLKTLSCNNTNISSLDLSQLTQLSSLSCSNNQLTDLDMSHCSQLVVVYCGGNLFTTLDFSHTIDMPQGTNFTNFDFSDNPNLKYLNYKMGIPVQFTVFQNCPSLRYVCANESDIAMVQTSLGSFGISGVEVNTYCSFVPGGHYNTIYGSYSFDADNNGCDGGDPKISYVKTRLDDASNSQMTISDGLGVYAFYPQTGNFIVTPLLENNYFNVSPTAATANMPVVDLTETHDFCVTAAGVHPDLEVVLMPVYAARPGFDALYKIVLRNKGTEIQSGQVNVSFDDARTDFVAAVPAPNAQSFGLLTWNFSNLLPFEIRPLELTLHLNSPTDSPAVNAGDILTFTTQITNTVGEETPADNTVVFRQQVVNSLDPNQKTCLDGATVLPENIGKYLHYAINFENIGSDDAANIVVKDVIDITKFDINSLELQYASHPIKTKVKDGVVEFIFESIDLPPFIVNPIGGHGNVLFKIKTQPTLPTGTEVTNGANIYFDYNTPIDTNVARTTFTTLGNTGFIKDKSVSVWPNPVKNTINVKAGNDIQSVELFDSHGRILQSVTRQKTEAKLDISPQQNGVYFVKVTTKDGIAIEKIIKK